MAVELSSGSLAIRYSKLAKRRRATITELVLEEDDAVYPRDSSSFFEQSREIESYKTHHKYTEEELEILGSFESHNYMPLHSVIYKEWLKTMPVPKFEWDMWFTMGLIGMTVGVIGFMLHEAVEVITRFKWTHALQHIQNGELVKAWLSVMGFSLLLVFGSSSLVVFMRPSAAGSGIPTLISFLNGTIIPRIFTLDVMMVKFVSCCFAVASGLPVGPEGPMIHLGSLVGAGISQYKSDLLSYKLPYFERFRNSESRRNFISAGAAAGVASAFHAPIGALLFCMEELSSFWNIKLAWQIFFCAMIATVTTDFLQSCFTKFKYNGLLGVLMTGNIFKVNLPLTVNIAIFLPAAVLGIIGGLLGAAFTIMHLKIIRFRRRVFIYIRRRWLQNVVKILEPLFIMVIVASVSVLTPPLFGCTEYHCRYNDGNTTIMLPNCANSGPVDNVQTSIEMVTHTCKKGVFIQMHNMTWTNKTYSEVASLMYGTMHDAIMHLFSRRTPHQFNYMSVFAVFVFQFFMSCWALCTYVSCGLVIPSLFIGSLYGRLFGIALHDLFSRSLGYTYLGTWLDPGAISLIGAASFFAGISRLTISLTVIMMEVTNEIEFLLPIMAAVMMAKLIGDYYTHPMYHAIIELRCIPFLSQEPMIIVDGYPKLNLELFSASDIMTCNPVVMPLVDTVTHYARILIENKHGGFPVITTSNDMSKPVFFGVITRYQLTTLLMHESVFQKHASKQIEFLDYRKMRMGLAFDEKISNLRLISYIFNPRYRKLYINIEPYVNQSAISVQDKFSLHRTYVIFTTLGVRHLTVVSSQNEVVGIITRKDLMAFNMEKKLKERIELNAQ